MAFQVISVEARVYCHKVFPIIQKLFLVQAWKVAHQVWQNESEQVRNQYIMDLIWLKSKSYITEIFSRDKLC